MATDRRVPVCRVSVGGSPLAAPEQARLVRARVELDPDLFSQAQLLFLDPHLELVNGAQFSSGQRVAVQMGLGIGAPEGLFDGEVTRLEPTFRRDEPISLLVTALDPLHKLALRQNTRSFLDSDAADVLAVIAQENGLTSDAPAGTKAHVLQNNLTDAEFLKRIASRMGMQLTLIGKLLRLAPASNDAPIQLSTGDGLRKLTLRRRAQGQVTQVTVHGWDEQAKQEVIGKADPEGEIGQGMQQFGVNVLSDTTGDLLPRDTATAETMAKGRLRKIAEGFITLQADAIGDARLVPGTSVELDKLGAGIDGTYRIQRARHEFSRHGYFVRFDAVWVGPKRAAPEPPRAPAKPYQPPRAKEAGKLSRPRWKRQPGEKKDTAVLAVDATKGHEGKSVTFVLETLVAGAFQEIARASGTIKNGVALANRELDALRADALSQPVWENAQDARHKHGDGAQVSVRSKLPAAHDVKLILEQQLPGSPIWQRVDAKTVKTAGGVAKATFDVAHPGVKEAAQKPSALLGAPRWTRKPEPGKPKTSGRIGVDAQGLADGRKVRLLVERLGRDGKWTALQSIDAVVRRGTAEAEVPLHHTAMAKQPQDAAQLSQPAWSKGDLRHGEPGTLSVQAPGLDGRRVRLIVERNDGGKWVAVGEQLATVAGGKAQAQFPALHPGHRAAAKDLGAAALDAAGFATVAAAGLDGQRVRFRLRRATGAVAMTAVAKVQGGAARARLAALEGATATAELLPDLAARRLRFRALVVPDLNAQRLRFRAEPVPDLLPRKTRFRAELPVPEHPALSRLTVKLVGGGEDDQVSTAAGHGDD